MAPFDPHHATAQGVPWRPGFFERRAAAEQSLPARFVEHATIAHAPDGSLHVRHAGDDITPEPGPYTAILCDGGAFHYFHLMESLTWLWALQHGFLGGRPPERIILSLAWNDPRQYGIGREIAAALWPHAILEDPLDSWPRQLPQILILNRLWAQMDFNKYLEAALPWATPHITAMSRTARQALQAYDRPTPTNRILYIPRPPPRHLAPALEAELLAALGPVTQVDFAAIPWSQQLRLAAAHDVMISVHGNGLTNAIWMRPGSLLIEIFSDGARHYDYQLFAELCGLDYLGLSGDRTLRAGDREAPPTGHGDANNRRIESAPIALIADEVRKRTNAKQK